MSKAYNLTIELAGIPVGISLEFESNYERCIPFKTDREPEFCVDITELDIAREKKRIEEQRKKENSNEGIPGKTMLEFAALHRKVTEGLIDYDVILLHGSAICVDGYAYIFTAKSGTGKSTHAKLWMEKFGNRATMINDDKPYLKFEKGSVVVYGSPWMGKHSRGSNISAKLKAIGYLNRSMDNRVERMSDLEAFKVIYTQTYKPVSAERLEMTLTMQDDLLSSAKFYKIFCNMDSEAADVSFEGLSS